MKLYHVFAVMFFSVVVVCSSCFQKMSDEDIKYQCQNWNHDQWRKEMEAEEKQRLLEHENYRQDEISDVLDWFKSRGPKYWHNGRLELEEKVNKIK